MENNLTILGVQKVSFKGKDGNDVSYYEMYCLGDGCNVSGERVINYMISEKAMNDFKTKYKFNIQNLAGKKIKDKTTTITQNHKLKITSFSVE